MSTSSPQTFRRECVVDPHAAPAAQAHARRLLRLLLAQDGSTTRLCETIGGGAVHLGVVRQHATADVPPIVRAQLPGERFIERVTFLAAHGEVMMDNLSYIALQGLEDRAERDLLAGTMPIGHLLARWWVRREFLSSDHDADGGMAGRLWQHVGLPDAAATRRYRIVTPEGARVLIAETYRRGMLMDRG